MKKLFLLMIISSNLIFAQYTTPNTGVNWNLNDLVSNSSGVVSGSFPNYTVNNLVVVSANDRVFIQPGSIVSFSATAAGFEVNGKFLAVGTASDSIIFTSANQDSTGAYEGFRFNDTAVDSACIISYARIEYAYYAFRCIGASPTFTNNYVYKSRRGGNLSSGSNPIFTHNKIERCYEYGITLTTGSSPVIEHNEFYNNNTQNTSPKNQISVGTQGNNSPSIKYNKIHGGMFNRTGGISISALFGGSSSSSEIAYNEIYNNSFGIVLSGGDITCHIHDNKIYNNNINPDVLISGSGINVNGNSLNAPVITSNEIFGNWWGVTIQNGTTIQAGPNPNLGNIENADPDDDGLNIIYDNIQGANIYDLYNNCTNDIMAQNNDWRVYDSLLIESHIFHKADDPAHGFVKFIPFSNFIPVELASFNASVNENSVILNWSTASEKNNKGFQVQRAKDKVQSTRISADDWKEIIFIEGSGTSTEIKNYSFIDVIAEAGKYIYRLIQIDYDGTATDLKQVEIELTSPEDFSLSQNYPNPFNPITNIGFQISNSGFVTLKIYDILGKEIATLVYEEKEPGIYNIEWNAEGLQSGVYFYRLKANSFSNVKKLLLLK